jgi:hypothetical protein
MSFLKGLFVKKKKDSAELEAPEAKKGQGPEAAEKPKKKGFFSKKESNGAEKAAVAVIDDMGADPIELEDLLDHKAGGRFGLYTTLWILLAVALAAVHVLFVAPTNADRAAKANELQEIQDNTSQFENGVLAQRAKLNQLRQRSQELLATLPTEADLNAWLAQWKGSSQNNRVDWVNQSSALDGNTSPNPYVLFETEIKLRRVSIELAGDYFDYLLLREQILRTHPSLSIANERVEIRPGDTRQAIFVDLLVRVI